MNIRRSFDFKKEIAPTQLTASLLNIHNVANIVINGNNQQLYGKSLAVRLMTIHNAKNIVIKHTIF